jgi:glycerol uptake facilitator-like aquaporin
VLLMSHPDLVHRTTAEAVGTALLLATVVGSGIMGERLAGGNTAIALLANALATGAGLVALILTFGPVSGAHFNPAVTLTDAMQGGIAWRDVPPYIAAQIAGAFGGVAAADVMFGEPVFSASRHARSGAPQMFSEFIATFGLLAVIWGVSRKRPAAIPFAHPLHSPTPPSRSLARQRTRLREFGRRMRQGSSSLSLSARWPRRDCVFGSSRRRRTSW